MHAVIATVGSDGDVFPFVGLGAALRERGHQATLVANEAYQDLAHQLDLGFYPLVLKTESDEFFANPNLWHPLRSGLVGARWGCARISRQFELLSKLCAAPDTILVANPTVFAARMVQEKLGQRLVSVVIGPWFIPSAEAPPAVAGIFNLPHGTPRVLLKLYCDTLHAIGDYFVKPQLNRARTEFGLPKVRRVFRWWYSPTLVIGMFPDWYAPPQPDWPTPMQLAGFSMFDGGNSQRLSVELRAYCHNGSPPIAITFGTEMWHAAEAFRAAIEACGRLGRRCLVLTRYSDQLPSPLPPQARHCDFAPFGQLFSQCAAVVHHGGMGTTARALAAGIPQLILPFAFDQVDNATRVKRLGVGDWLKPKRRRAEFISKALAQLLAPQGQNQSRTIAAQFDGQNSLERAADWIEEVACSR
jgi:UDP:flavonoid glycosyltransferase YjiC (YdhE family)